MEDNNTRKVVDALFIINCLGETKLEDSFGKINFNLRKYTKTIKNAYDGLQRGLNVMFADGNEIRFRKFLKLHIEKCESKITQLEAEQRKCVQIKHCSEQVKSMSDSDIDFVEANTNPIYGVHIEYARKTFLLLNRFKDQLCVVSNEHLKEVSPNVVGESKRRNAAIEERKAEEKAEQMELLSEYSTVLTMKEVEQILRCSRSHLYGLKSRGLLLPNSIPEQKVTYLKSDVLRYLKITTPQCLNN